MRKLKIIAATLILANSFWSCEKDDICAEGTPTTPNLVIEFYDAANPNNLKAVTNLGVVASGFTTGIAYNGVSKIKIPLKVNEDLTTLEFIQNGSDSDTTNDNSDILTFNYVRSDVFISRACGYKTVFQLNDSSPEVINDGNMWIQSRTVTQPNIQNENETHIKIYF